MGAWMGGWVFPPLGIYRPYIIDGISLIFGVYRLLNEEDLRAGDVVQVDYGFDGERYFLISTFMFP